MKLFAVLVIVATLVYWRLKERSSDTDQSRGGYSPPKRLAIRLALPTVSSLIILQFLGIVNLPLPVSSSIEIALQIIGYGLFGAGTALAIWARETLADNWAHAAEYQIKPRQSLVTNGPFRYVRHPIYLGIFCMFVGAEIALASWLIIIAVPLAVFFWRQALKEERLLQKQFGKRYTTYKNRAHMFLPV